MLDVTRIDSETLKISSVPVPVKRIFSDLAGDLVKAAAERNIELVIEQDADTPSINADPSLIQKALYHLVVNAIKYTPDGGRVTLRSRPVTLENNVQGVELSVYRHRHRIGSRAPRIGIRKILSGGRCGDPLVRENIIQRRRTWLGAGNCARRGAGTWRQGMGGKFGIR